MFKVHIGDTKTSTNLLFGCILSQLTFTCSKSTTEIAEKGFKYFNNFIKS